MNEPSVFESEQQTFPLQLEHKLTNSTKQYDYFNFNPIKFPTERLEEINR